MIKEVWAYSDKPALVAELIAGARLLAAEIGASVEALSIGPRAEAEKLAAFGAERVYWLGEKKTDCLVEDYIPTMASLLKERRPALVLIGATRRGRAVAGRLAAQFGISAITDVKESKLADGKFAFSHMIFGGAANRTELSASEVTIVTVGSGMYTATPVDGITAEIVETPFVEPKWRVKHVESREEEVAAVNLAAAKQVVCAGRGLGKQEDLAMIQELARALKAEVGCSRPLAEGLDWLPRERYIGVSGAVIKPDLYVGIGVSGQVQHMVGLTDSKVVVAINRDSGAPIFQQADYGIVGDLYAVVPKLIEALQARK